VGTPILGTAVYAEMPIGAGPPYPGPSGETGAPTGSMHVGLFCFLGIDPSIGTADR
jgi:hypothetical protein